MNELTDIDKVKLAELRLEMREFFRTLIMQEKMDMNAAQNILQELDRHTRSIPPVRPIETNTRRRLIVPAQWLDCPDCKGQGGSGFMKMHTCKACKGTGGSF